jgi:signal transduction histidine kinase
MKVIQFIVCFLFIASAQLAGQGSAKDSFDLNSLPTDRSPEEWMHAYNELMDQYVYAQPDTVLSSFKRVLPKLDTTEPKQYLYELFTNKAVAQYIKSDFLESFRTHQTALRYARALGNRDLEARTLNSMGATLSGHNKLEKALEYHHKSLQIAKEIKSDRNFTRNNLNIGIIYYEQGKLDSAYQAFVYADSGSQSLNDLQFQALSKAWQAEVLYEKDLHEDAESTYKDALQLPETSLWDKGFIYSGLAQVYLASNQIDRAIEAAQKSIEIGREVKSLWDLQRAYQVMARAYADRENYEQAYDYHKLYKSVSDSIFNLEKEKQVNYLLLQEEKLQNQLLEETTAHQKSQLEQNRLIIAISILALVLLFAVIIILIRWNREHKSLNKQLRKQKEEILMKNEELSALNEEKDFLIGMVAHDLRTPLSNIHGLLDLIKEDDSISEETKLYLQKIEESEQKMDSLIRRILNIKAIEKKELDLNMSRIQLSATLFETADTFKSEAIEKNIELKKINLLNDTAIKADKEYLEQVFENLISNAIKFSPPDTSVILRITEMNDHFLVQVIDEGPGISEEDQAHLFNMYNQLSAKPTAGESSTGLGLAIVKKIVDAMEADIWCESKLGEGSTFNIAFKKFGY